MPSLYRILVAGLLAAGAAQSTPLAAPPAERLSLAPCRIPVEGPDPQAAPRETEARCGTFQVAEDRAAAGGRMLALRVIVLPARAAAPREPVFFLSGGPGQAATEQAGSFADWWYREDRDVVLMDMRGTGEGTGLDCALGGSDENPQTYLEPLFADGAGFAACRAELSGRADLTQYTTPIAMRDLDELREALGHEHILIEAGSYGTRAALTYIRMFGPRVRAAVLSSLSAVENRAPLFHAAAAQRAFELLAGECRAESACSAAFPDVPGDLAAVLERLRREPARVRVAHPVTGAPVQLGLSAPGFADGLRVMLYSTEAGRRVPLLLRRARAGDLGPFAEAALRGSRRFKGAIRTGLLLSVSCSEDVWRIRPDEIARETAGSFIGDRRVRGQMAACSVWPRGEVPDEYYRPFRSDVPVLLISGHLDPVTPPSWGEVVRNHLPNSVHVVFPGAHTPLNDCATSLTRRLFLTGRVAGLDTSCVAAERNPPFVLTDAPGAAD